MKRFYFFTCLVALVATTHAQGLSHQQLAKALADPAKEHMARIDSLIGAVSANTGPAERPQLLAFLGSQENGNLYAAARSLVLKGLLLCGAPFHSPQNGFETLDKAISRAVESGDEYLMVEVFDRCAYTFISEQQQKALFYFLKSAELRKKLGDRFFAQKDPAILGTIGELLYRVQDYRQAAHYLQKMMALPTPGLHPYMTSMNTMGLAYHRMGRFDSALYWYRQALQGADARRDTVWQGIISGNIGAVYFDQGKDEAALPLLWKDYETTLRAESGNAGNTLHRLALIFLRRGRPDSALRLAREGFRLIGSARHRDLGFIRNACGALAKIYLKRGEADSAIFYNNRFHQLNDSLNQWVANNRADLVQARLEFEKKSGLIQVLLQEKKTEETRRNLLAAALVLLLVAAWLYLRWQKQRHLNQQQALRHQKEKAEAEVRNAREQLDAFTRNSISKNELIEQLQGQLALYSQQVNEELVRQTILTENDWLRFRDMFNKAHPGFLQGLQQAAPGITTAELRLAALIKLNIGNKHIASMLGIGTDAVRKTKSRLRQRLGITVERDLDEYVRRLNPAETA